MKTRTDLVSSLIEALETRAHKEVEGSRLVTVNIEPLYSETNEEPEISVRLLKASARACFLQAFAESEGQPVMKARAVFRKS